MKFFNFLSDDSYSRPNEEDRSQGVTCTRKTDETDVAASTRFQNAPSDRDANQHAKSNNRETGCYVPAVILCLAQLSETNGGEADIAARRIAKDDGVHNRQWRGGVQRHQIRRKPKGEGRNHREQNMQRRRVHPPDGIADVSRDPTTEERPGIENGEDLVRERTFDSNSEGERSEVRDGHEHSPLDEEDSGRHGNQAQILEHPEVRHHVLSRQRLRWEARPNEQVCQNQEKHIDTPQGSCGPAKTRPAEYRLKHQGEEDPSDGPSTACKTGGSCSPPIKVMAYRCEAGAASNEVPTPPRMLYVRMKCQYSGAISKE